MTLPVSCQEPPALRVSTRTYPGDAAATRAGFAGGGEDHTARVVHVVLVGELDLATAAQLVSAVTVLPGGLQVVVDLADLDFVDVAGLGALLRAREVLRAAGSRLTLAGVRLRHLRLMQIIGMDTLLDVVGPPATEQVPVVVALPA